MLQFFRSLFEKFLRIPKVVRGKDKFIKVDYECEHITLGNSGAAWTICPHFLNEDSVVYSFGIGYDISFDLEIINCFDLGVYAFDPTPKSVEWVKKQNLPKQFVLKEYGLAHFDGKAKFHPPENPEYISATLLERSQTEDEAYKVEVKTLKTIMTELGHEQINLLKMDVEGAEYDIIDNMIESKIRPAQLLVEFHHRFDNVGINKTTDIVRKLREYGYLIFYISKTGEEISFISKEFSGF